MADYVASVIGALDGVSALAVLVGHSFGGSVISRVAELRPEGVTGSSIAARSFPVTAKAWRTASQPSSSSSWSRPRRA